MDVLQDGEDVGGGEEGQLHGQAEHEGLPRLSSLGIKIKMGSKTIIPELLELLDKSVKLCDEHFEDYF